MSDSRSRAVHSAATGLFMSLLFASTTVAQIPNDRVRLTLEDGTRHEAVLLEWGDSLVVLLDTNVALADVERLEVWHDQPWTTAIMAGVLSGAIAGSAARESTTDRVVGALGIALAVFAIARALRSGDWQEVPFRRPTPPPNKRLKLPRVHMFKEVVFTRLYDIEVQSASLPITTDHARSLGADR